ncbi:MAG: GntR family transcriptional regulator [Bryobacterales bacterium]|nr:GntR family transcriptional regulator [Bryobacterales bacterium]
MKTEVPVLSRRKPADYAESAYRRLCDAILEGRLMPGTPLSRRVLAAEFGMSTVPVGEALLRLEAEGLVESRPRAGSRVRIPTASEIQGNYELREALETHSARLFAERATDADRKALVAAAEKLDAMFDELKRKPYSAARHAQAERKHMRFHMLIAGAGRCVELENAIERSRVLLFNWLFTMSAEFGELPGGWHGTLARKLVGGSPREAAEAMRVHVRYRKDEVIERLSELAGPETARMARGPQRHRNGGSRK